MYIIDPVAAERVKEYLAITTQAYPAAELVYSTTIIQQILNSLGTEDDFFVGIQDQLMGRCKAIRSIFKDGGDKFKIKSPCGNMYILVKWYVQVVVFFFGNSSSIPFRRTISHLIVVAVVAVAKYFSIRCCNRSMIYIIYINIIYIYIVSTEVVDGESCKEKYFDPINLSVSDGESMGINNSYIRIAFGYDQPHFDVILEKLQML